MFFHWLLGLPILLVVATLLSLIFLLVFRIADYFWGPHFFDRLAKIGMKEKALDEREKKLENEETRLRYERSSFKNEELRVIERKKEAEQLLKKAKDIQRRYDTYTETWAMAEKPISDEEQEKVKEIVAQQIKGQYSRDQFLRYLKGFISLPSTPEIVDDIARELACQFSDKKLAYYAIHTYMYKVDGGVNAVVAAWECYRLYSDTRIEK
ncbi:hypothetical protein [Limosilactobacillus agrestis]|uniref:hypothetical protein n=1 Tax=Limosilactobacillus agrestis TaxID=2759748 RepID=UPI001E3C6A1D|nr:hypothetical protein [Limosilactobacillus agrestis]MCD7112056.1 hypothetical protein [Limosilactobacillus agrestis]